jgi:outer membrane protein assembly factor BamA
MASRLAAAVRAALLCACTATSMLPVAASGAPAAPTVVSVAVTGNAHVTTDRILGVVSTKAGDPFDPAKVQRDLRAIADLGFFADQAPPLIRTTKAGVAITFRVVENAVVSAIRFRGNARVSDATLLALMDTAPGQVFNVATYRQDALKLDSYYDKVGYGGQLASHVVDMTIASDGVLTVVLREGLAVRNVVITTAADGADPVLAPSLLSAALDTKPGTAYSDAQREKDDAALQALYAKHDMKLGDVEGGIDPATVDLNAGTADVRYTVSVLRVGAVQITGNTRTQDDVIRRELRLRPGSIVSDAALRRDYERLNNLGLFAKVDFEAKPGPDPRRPSLVTLDWQVKEQRTGSATFGGSYSGGATGTGLAANVGFSENNLNGTGNGVSVKVTSGTNVKDAQLSFTVPHLGASERASKYSLTTTLFSQAQTYAYPVYVATPSPTASAAQGTPVSLVPADPTNYQLVSGVSADYRSRSTGISTMLGRRLNDTVSLSLGANVQSIAASATVPSGYYFPSSTALNPTTATTSDLTGLTSVSTALGITAPSLANIDASKPYAIHSLVFGAGADTRDDVANPRRGFTASVADEYSSTALKSDFNYQIVTLDAARYFPVGRNATFAVHGRAGFTTGAIPATKLFTFSDQELRGYSTVFYGTDILLGQAELRIPLSADRKFSAVTFFDAGASRIRGGTAVATSTTPAYDVSKFTLHSDLGVGLRFDVPQLGLRTLRLDFAVGSQGTHTSFGIGQSF